MLNCVGVDCQCTMRPHRAIFCPTESMASCRSRSKSGSIWQHRGESEMGKSVLLRGPTNAWIIIHQPAHLTHFLYSSSAESQISLPLLTQKIQSRAVCAHFLFKIKLFLSIFLLPVKTSRRILDLGPLPFFNAHLPNRSKAVQVFRIVPRLKQAEGDPPSVGWRFMVFLTWVGMMTTPPRLWQIVEKIWWDWSNLPQLKC